MFASEDLLRQVVVERMLAGVATRRHEQIAEPVGPVHGRAMSKSAVSRRFLAATEQASSELLARDLSGLETAVLMIDGLNVADQMTIVAVVITADGTKVPVGMMFTVARLGLPKQLRVSLMNTNCIESMISIARDTTGRVKHWKTATMKKRWIAASMLEAERSFRRIKGHADMAALVTSVHLAAGADTPTEYAQAVTRKGLGSPPDFNRQRDTLPTTTAC